MGGRVGRKSCISFVISGGGRPPRGWTRVDTREGEVGGGSGSGHWIKVNGLLRCRLGGEELREMVGLGLKLFVEFREG